MNSNLIGTKYFMELTISAESDGHAILDKSFITHSLLLFSKNEIIPKDLMAGKIHGINKKSGPFVALRCRGPTLTYIPRECHLYCGTVVDL